MATITVLSPVGELRQATFAVPPLPADLRGLTVGFVDNTKHNFDLLIEGMTVLLKERFGVKAVVHRKKANASTPAADEIIEGLAKDCDVVFAGSGD
ncbi:MAG: hypothetical protein DME16_09255 [Candidatus Rokuibacteriota bacterium]|jgi:hypothetical protein|nr:MAG: hypothetical protein DME16_09255 [Candidatus Rokubacteria bacterium]HWN53744.1 hypothetical protein [Methylomirabilota bacterium]